MFTTFILAEIIKHCIGLINDGDIAYEKLNKIVSACMMPWLKFLLCHFVVDIQKLTYSALVLAMLFSTGEAVPLQYYGMLTLHKCSKCCRHIG